MTNEKAEFLIEQMLKGTWHLTKTEEGRALISPVPGDVTIDSIHGAECKILIIVSHTTYQRLLGQRMNVSKTEKCLC
jgi:hypothetical protein